MGHTEHPSSFPRWRQLGSASAPTPGVCSARGAAGHAATRAQLVAVFGELSRRCCALDDS
eukprot:365123-Chlamydomonas_euryale.AAC.38